jgi:hypothetical protein
LIRSDLVSLPSRGYQRPDLTGISSPAEEEVFSDTTSQGSSKPKYELSVELPSSRKRSRLATEKTTSADNLTLGSPVDRKIKRNSSLMDVEVIDEVRRFANDDTLTDHQVKEEEPSVATGGKRIAFSKHEASKENQPFNIGTHSTVKKQTASDLALSADELEDLKTIPKTKTKAKAARAPRLSKAKAKAAVKALDSSDDELTLKSESEEEDGDFAMDSDDEEKQVQQAIKASRKVARAATSSAGTSSAASSTGKARGKKAVKGGNLLRTAARKAASRMFIPFYRMILLSHRTRQS